MQSPKPIIEGPAALLMQEVPPSCLFSLKVRPPAAIHVL